MVAGRGFLRNHTSEIWVAGLDTQSLFASHAHSVQWEIERMLEGEEARGVQQASVKAYAVSLVI